MVVNSVILYKMRMRIIRIKGKMPEVHAAGSPIAAHENVAASRYRLLVMNCPDSGARIQVVDRERECQLFDWSGYVARHLLDSGDLDRLALCRCGCHPCDKEVVWHLALRAAAARSVYAGLSPTHRHVARILLQNPSHHHTSLDVQCLMAAERQPMTGQAINTCLSDLVRWNMLQRIVVDTDNVFYDVVTKPHPHVFDPVSRSLRDA